MKSSWCATILVGFSTAGFWMLFVPAAEIKHVQFGSTVLLSCNISYIYPTTWFKQNPDLPPTVVLRVSLRGGEQHHEFQLNSRFSVELINRTRALKISDVHKKDLGLYYCIAVVNEHLTIGRGTMLQGFHTTAGFPMLSVPAKESKNVEFSSTVTLSCNIKYIYGTTWFKQNPDLPPTEVLRVTFTGGKPHQEFQLSSRFSTELINRSLALKIIDVEESDTGLYYCIANTNHRNQRLTVGRGTMLQGFSGFIFKGWYCVVIGFVVLILLLAVFITHWRTKQNKRTIKIPPLFIASEKMNPLPTSGDFKPF